MSFPRYEAYKESGVEWLGQVPAHWKIERLKRVSQVTPSNVDKKCVDGEQEVRLCNYTDVYYNDVITADMEFMSATATTDQIAKFGLRAGQTIITKDSETADDIAISAYVPEDLPGVVCGYHLSVVTPASSAHGPFLKRFFDSSFAKACFEVRANGLTRVGLGQYALDNVELPFPPKAEQIIITAFLDRETAKIDALMEAQRRLIELLKEKRQAVISRAVTKGLNPDAPMKDSGVEWLGEVPAHWTVRPLKALIASGSSISYGIVQPGEPQDEGVPFVQTTNMTSGTFDPALLQKTTAEIAASYPRSRLIGGEVVLGIRASIGAAHVVPDNLAGANLSRGVARIAPDDKLVSASFLVLFFSSHAATTYWQLGKQGSTFNEVSIETVRELAIAIPPLNEQETMCADLAGTTEALGQSVKDCESAIALLQERRSALISAAVTGKIDVRGLVPTEAEAA